MRRPKSACSWASSGSECLLPPSPILGCNCAPPFLGGDIRRTRLQAELHLQPEVVIGAPFPAARLRIVSIIANIYFNHAGSLALQTLLPSDSRSPHSSWSRRRTSNTGTTSTSRTPSLPLATQMMI
jgi:hypothetical protein